MSLTRTVGKVLTSKSTKAERTELIEVEVNLRTTLFINTRSRSPQIFTRYIESIVSKYQDLKCVASRPFDKFSLLIDAARFIDRTKLFNLVCYPLGHFAFA